MLPLVVGLVLGCLLALLFHTQGWLFGFLVSVCVAPLGPDLLLAVGATLQAVLQNFSALLPAARSLGWREVASLPQLLPLLRPEDVRALAPHAARLAPHAPRLFPVLSALSPHFPVLMRRLDLLVPRLDQLLPLLPKLLSTSDSVACLPFLLDAKVLPVLLDHLDDLPPQHMASSNFSFSFSFSFALI